MGETNWRTDNTTQREMTLDEWCATLPEGHRARMELTRLRTALAEVERAGAERAAKEAWRLVKIHPKGWSDEDAERLYVNAILRALFPPPGAEVGRGD